MNAKPIYFHTLSPLHVGAGRGTGLIDLPILREKATNLPIIPGSSVKGVLRDATEKKLDKSNAKQESDEVLNLFFGSASNDAARAGAVAFSDAYLLCLPVRATRSTFAWVTCPSILLRHARDLKSLGINPPKNPDCQNKVLLHSDNKSWDAKIYLEDLDLDKGGVAHEVDAWCDLIAMTLFTEDAWKKAFQSRFMIVPDEIFQFLAEHGTEVRAHIHIDDETKIVAKGALWYEESLPAETILAGIVWQDEALAKSHDFIAEVAKLLKDELQFGGKATTGLGRMNVRFGG